MLQARQEPNSKLFWADSEEGSNCGGKKKESEVSSILQGDAGVFQSQTILKEGFLEFNGEHLAQAAKSISLHNIMLARVEQERWLHFNLLHRTFIQN